MEGGRFGAAIEGGNLDQHVLGGGLGIFDGDVEVAVVVEDAGVDQFVFEIRARAMAVCFDQVSVGKRALRILVQVPHV